MLKNRTFRCNFKIRCTIPLKTRRYSKLDLNILFSFLTQCYHPHMSRESVSPICGLFCLRLHRYMWIVHGHSVGMSKTGMFYTHSVLTSLHQFSKRTQGDMLELYNSTLHTWSKHLNIWSDLKEESYLVSHQEPQTSHVQPPLLREAPPPQVQLPGDPRQLGVQAALQGHCGSTGGGCCTGGQTSITPFYWEFWFLWICLKKLPIFVPIKILNPKYLHLLKWAVTTTWTAVVAAHMCE